MESVTRPFRYIRTSTVGAPRPAATLPVPPRRSNCEWEVFRCGMIKLDCRLSRVALLHRWGSSFGVRSAFGSIAIALLWQLPIWASDDDRGWDFRPYRIKAVVALDVPGGLAEKIGR